MKKENNSERLQGIFCKSYLQSAAILYLKIEDLNQFGVTLFQK